MKQIYKSEITGNIYETEEECLKAEEAYKADKEEKALKKSKLSKEKKELATKITDASIAVNEAYKRYDEAKEEARKIVQEARKKAEEVLREAAKEVEHNSEEHMNLIKEFNDKYGPYMKTYYGDRAVEEYNRIVKRIRSLFRDFWF